MIDRGTSTPGDERAVWADTTRFGALARGRAAGHRGPRRARRRAAADAAACRERAPVVDEAFVAAVLERERTTDHDVAAFVDVVQERIGAPAGAWIHYGLTSSDVVDTALCWALRDAADLVLEATDELLTTLVELARAHRDTVMIGRTHGIHAEPTTFGAKVALWALQLDRDRARLAAARAVGRRVQAARARSARTPTSIPAVEALRRRAARAAARCRRRRSSPATATPSSSARCAAVGATCELVAVELRHLQRTEVGEVREGFKPGQKGSSAMPHKRNPISAETISGLARVVRSNLLAGLQDVALWHERDISHSSVERIVLPDSSAARALHGPSAGPPAARAAGRRRADAREPVVEPRTGVQPARAAGAGRGWADSRRRLSHRATQRDARRGRSGRDFRTLLEDDPEVTLSKDAMLDEAFDLERSLRHIERVAAALDELRPPA